MQRQRFFAAGAGTAAALLLATRGTIAPASAEPSQLDSDADVWRVRGRLEGMVSQLNGLEADYNGQRVAAINALQAAKADLDAAVKVRGMNDGLSDAIMRVALVEADEMIKRLSADRGDYNGQKSAAIDKLQAARTALTAAIKHA